MRGDKCVACQKHFLWPMIGLSQHWPFSKQETLQGRHRPRVGREETLLRCQGETSYNEGHIV